MSRTHELTATARESLGTRHSKQLRAEGKLPAVLYGHKKAAAHLTLDAKEAITHFEAGEKLFELRLENGATETALLKDLGYDYLGRRIIHVDFERVNLDETVTVNVPIHLKGDAKGLKSAGAILIHPASEISVTCRVRDMQDALTLDISGLDVGDSLHAGQIELPSGWTLASDPETVLAAIQVTKEQAEGEAAEVAAEAQPERIAEKKEDEPKA